MEVVATTFLAYLLNTYALKDLSPSVVSMYIYTQPFLATLFAVFLGKDTLTPTKVLSAVFYYCRSIFGKHENKNKELKLIQC